jgi:hypothetical protein
MQRSTSGSGGRFRFVQLIALAFMAGTLLHTTTSAQRGRRASEEPLRLVRMAGEGGDAIQRQLEAQGFDVSCGVTVTEAGVEFVVSKPELDRLRGNGLVIDEIASGRPLREILAEQEGSVPSGYPDLDAVITQMMQAASAHPNLCQFVDLTTRYGTPTTFEGRHMHAVKISDNVTVDEDEPTVMFVSAHHSREIVTPVIALAAIEHLTNGYGNDPAITALVDDHEIWIAPVWNPDGYNHVFTGDNLWRKNRRVFAGGVGVDLNRNYPFGWSSPCSGSNTISSQTYRGPSSASEPETKTMIALAEDRHFAKLFDYHSFGREVRYGYGCWNHPLLSFLISEASRYASKVAGYAIASSCCTAGDIHYHSANNGTHAFLWETQTTFQPSYSAAQLEADRLIAGMDCFMRRPISVSGHVTDADSGLPVVAMVSNNSIFYQNGESNRSGGPFGRYHATLPSGSYQLQFSAAGYQTQMRNVTVTGNSSQVIDVVLTSTCPEDVTGDGKVNARDFMAVLLAEPCTACPGGMPADVNRDGSVNAMDAFAVLAALGACN